MREKILIIDDDRTYISQIAEILEEEGYLIGFTTNPQVGYTMLDSAEYDLIILDIHMPRITGLEVLKELKSSKTTKLIPILMSTGDSSKDSVQQAIQLGADDYIVKPIELDLFLDKVFVLLKIRNFVKKWGVLPR